MSLRLSHFVPSVPLIVAQKERLITDDDVVTIRTTGSAEQLRALIAGEVDVAVTAIDNLFEWVKLCPDLRLIAQIERTTPIAFYATSEITGWEDLEGKVFGVDALSNGFSLAARWMLKEKNTSVEYLEVGGVRERMDALVAGEIDATLLGPPFDVLAEKAHCQRIGAIEELLPEFPGQGLVTRASAIDSAPMRKFLTALAEATRLIGDMDDAEGETLLEDHGFDVAAASAWRSRPETLQVDASGLALLTRIRSDLGALSEGVDLLAIHDPKPLGGLF